MPETTILTIRPATPADLVHLHPVIERAYRGDSARGGWTHEADILEGQRTSLDDLAEILTRPAERLLVAEEDGRVIGCVQVTDRGDGLAYLGLLCIEPTLQAAGLGRQLIAEAESCAARLFRAKTMEMTVIDSRAELIAYYERRGYRLTGEGRPFPIEVTPPLRLAVLEKPLG